LEEIRPPFGLVTKVIKPWNETAKMLMSDEDFGDFITRKGAMKEELATVINDKMTPMEKAQAIYNYVGKNFDTLAYSYRPWVTSFLKDMKQKKKVTMAEKNLIFMNMLTTAGIEVTPVIIRTKDEGRLSTNLAVLRRFNSVIGQVKIDKDTFFVDVTGYPQPMKLLPENTLSGYGVAFLGKENYTMLTPQSKLNTRRYTQANLTLNTEGVLEGEVKFTHSGYEGYQSRKAIKEQGMDKFVQQLTKELVAEGKLISQKFENEETTTEASFKGVVTVNTTGFVNKTEDKIYITPLLCFGDTENPFKSDTRQFAVDFGAPRDVYYQLSLTIPAGYKVEEAPKSTRMTMPESKMKYEFLIDVKENKISINTKFNIKNPSFNAEEYPDLKQFYAQMLAKMGEQIVLTKGAADEGSKK
jgi:hypothetical protein